MKPVIVGACLVLAAVLLLIYIAAHEKPRSHCSDYEYLHDPKLCQGN